MVQSVYYIFILEITRAYKMSCKHVEKSIEVSIHNNLALKYIET